jgi:hypothetical protein
MSLAHHGCSAATAWLAFPSPAAPIVIGSSTGGPMLLNMRTSAMLRPSMTAKMMPPTMPACNAAFDPPRDASTAPVQKPDICRVNVVTYSRQFRPAYLPPLTLLCALSLFSRVTTTSFRYAKSCRASKQARVCCAFQSITIPCALECGAGRGG